MKLRANPCFKAASEILDRARIPYTVDDHGRHYKAVFTFAGKTHKVSFSRTPSDHRSAMNTANVIRRILESNRPEPNQKRQSEKT